jgi:DNA-binding winged helix-turn-helix (wHTH) protein
VVYVIGDYTLSTAAWELQCAGKPLAISLLAVEVMAFLIEHRHRVVTRAELLDNVWSDAHVQHGSITQSIWQIRQAFGDTPKRQSVIRTVRSRGHRFVADVHVRSSAEPSPDERGSVREKLPTPLASGST